jgi:methanogenic corrinoid protein MtbC1
MEKIDFMNAFNEENKDKCVETALNLIDGKMTLPQLYEEVLAPALYSIDECKDDDCIWREHIKTSIIRTVIECMYPHVIEFKKNTPPLGIKVILACPEKEYHEIGLRMVDDLFSILGYETIFIGTNTPKNQVLNAVMKIKPKYLAISVTDYYLLFEADKMINNIKSSLSSVKVIVGGRAFKYNLESVEKIGGDIYLETFQDLVKLKEGDANEIIL